MDDGQDALALRFEAHRPHLRSVAFRMLGSLPEAEDAVQETWFRLSRSGGAGIDNLPGWLTTVVARICLDALRVRAGRRDRPVGVHLRDGLARSDEAPGPADEALLADSVGLAMLVVLDTLEPAERLAFVLHDVFAVPFEEIAGIVGRSPAAARQLASRARRRVQGSAVVPEADAARHRRAVAAFLAASRAGDFAGLLAVLDPGVVLRVNPRTATASEAVGAAAVARQAQFHRARAPYSRLALVDGAAGIVVEHGGRLRVAMRFRTAGDRVTGIDVLMSRESLGAVDLAPLAA